MSSRKEEKERLRQERIAREQAEATATARKKRLLFGGGGAALIAAIAIIAVAVASGGGGKGSSNSGSSSTGGSGATAGVSTGPAPWQPEYANLGTRFEALGLPQVGQETYHKHSILRVYINGKQQPVPGQIGLDPQGTVAASLHTHDTSGIVHIESDNYFPFTLGQFMDVWGVKFTPTQVGAYYNQGNNVVATYVNGKKIADPVNYKMQSHDRIVIGYGPAGSFPTDFTVQFPQGY